jgi:lysyl-tRNA synthetase class 1
MHWADHAARLLEQRESPVRIAAGITPSGEFHIGHLREILTGEMIHRACEKRGIASEFVFVVDSMDPLRRVYDFLSSDYEEYIGCPLHTIPAPDSTGSPDSSLGSYAEYFLKPFLEALDLIGVRPKLIWNHESYADGRFEESIRMVIERRDEIREIIETRSSRELDADWFPYSPLSSRGSLDGVKVTSWDDPYVFWSDSSGAEGRADIRKDDGKLPWRIDWPARWGFLGITLEPFGKDHAAAGGSYDTGKPIAELLGHPVPLPIKYEWIVLKGAGAMSSSAGNTVGPIEALRLVPPEIIRYLIARSKPGRHIEFDTGSALIEMADEYERQVEKLNASNHQTTDAKEQLSRRQQIAAEVDRARIEYSQIESDDDPSDSIAGVSFRHLALVAQIRANDEDVWNSLRSSGHITGKASETLVDRLFRMRAWINSNHFPERFRLRPRSQPTEQAQSKVAEEDKKFLSELAKMLSECVWIAPSINECICDAARENGLRLREAYVLLYWLVLDQDFGPRLAAVLAEIKQNDVIGLLNSAAA